MYSFMRQHITGEKKVYLITYENGLFEKSKHKEKYRCENLVIRKAAIADISMKLKKCRELDS